MIIDRKCKLVTIFDIFFNQLKETLNGNGSCGMGINETIARNEDIRFTYNKIYNNGGRDDHLDNILMDIQMYYAEKVYNLVGNIESVPENLKAMAGKIFNPDFVRSGYSKAFLETCVGFTEDQVKYLKKYDQTLSLMFADHSLIFEGAQGLMLDEYYGNFPYVTRSRTGSQNVVDFCREYGVKIDHIYYVTRCYSTRHGKDEYFKPQNIEKYVKVVDTTNVTNQWQGTIQYAPLNLILLMEFINLDLSYKLCSNVTIVITCLDQLVTDYIPVVEMFHRNGNPDNHEQVLHLSTVKIKLHNHIHALTGASSLRFIEFHSKLNKPVVKL